MTTTSKLGSAAQALAFINGGNARFTLKSLRTTTRYTYRVQTAEFNTDKAFVQLLTGPDNEQDFTYIGMLAKPTQDFYCTAKSKLGVTSLPAVALIWTLSHLRRGVLPEGLEVWHEGRCCACGRALTVPESIAAGIGPDCASRRPRAEAVSISALFDGAAA